MLTKASKSNNYHYNKNLLERARHLRNNSTKAEIYLWNDVLKGGFLGGYQFLRQRPILNFIADFVCLEVLLVIEVDGVTHEWDITVEKDQKKQEALQEIGFTVLRYSDWEVMHHRDEIAVDILRWIEDYEKMKG